MAAESSRLVMCRGGPLSSIEMIQTQRHLCSVMMPRLRGQPHHFLRWDCAVGGCLIDSNLCCHLYILRGCFGTSSLVFVEAQHLQKWCGDNVRYT